MNEIIITDLELRNTPLDCGGIKIDTERKKLLFNLRTSPHFFMNSVGFTAVRDLQRGGFVIIPDKC